MVPDIGERHTLGSVKRVYGGLFSGRNPLLDQKEDLVIKTFLMATVACKARTSTSVRGKRKKLQNARKLVITVMHNLMDHEVDCHLERFVKILLSPKTELAWNPRANSCQQFADKLLQGKDFDHLYPRFPTKFVEHANVRDTAEFPWPRYLLSFNDRIDSVSASGSSPNSIVSRFSKEDRGKCDLVEFARLAFVEQARNWETAQSEEERRHLVKELFLLPDEISDTIHNTSIAKPNAIMVNTLWECPRDSMSFMQSHAIRPFDKYSGSEGGVLKSASWLENRLRMQQQLDVPVVSAARY